MLNCTELSHNCQKSSADTPNTRFLIFLDRELDLIRGISRSLEELVPALEPKQVSMLKVTSPPVRDGPRRSRMLVLVHIKRHPTPQAASLPLPFKQHTSSPKQSEKLHKEELFKSFIMVGTLHNAGHAISEKVQEVAHGTSKKANKEVAKGECPQLPDALLTAESQD